VLGVSALAVASPASAQPVVVVVSTDACAAYAQNYTNAHVGPRQRPAVVGTLIGAGIGALVGGAGWGTPVIGAAVGGGIGLGIGAAGGNPQWDQTFNYAFQACMQGYVLAW
jgi:hypothetical protein